MQYMGSKSAIAKYLLPFMLPHRTCGMLWVEPFVGGANMIDKVGGPRLGCDSHRFLIALLRAVQSGWVPPSTVTKEEYYDIKANPHEFQDHVVGFVGFLCSFGGKWWGGYAQNKKGTNYAATGSKVLTRQATNLCDVTFLNQSYDELELGSKSLIYCDPPYAGTTNYESKFSHDKFWDWCRKQKQDGHVIFVSEYNAPDDFHLLTTIQHKTRLDKNAQYPRIEKLYTLL